jgi:hypothetical protein
LFARTERIQRNVHWLEGARTVASGGDS